MTKMIMNYLKTFWIKSFHLHQMNEFDDLNFYYQKFLSKLSKISLKIFLPLLSLIYLFTLFLCRLFLSNQIFHIRTIIFLVFLFISFFILILIRLHTKWKKLWIFTRFLIILLLILPLIITYQTEQFHILFSTIAILIIYSLLTFTLFQSLFISLSISIIHIFLSFNHWNISQLFSMIFYHFIIHFTGLYFYIGSIQHIREHFYAYRNNLFEKNQYNVDCKKLHTIIRYCQQSNISSNNNSLSKPGTIIYCSISLNEQTRLHTPDELASLIDVLYCQIEQLIIKNQPDAQYKFDNETILINIFNNDNNEQLNIDRSCRLAIELFRFIQYVNNLTQWNLTLIIGIDYYQMNRFSFRWLQEEYLIKDRIYISSKIYEILKDNQFYQFSTTTNHSIYLLFNEIMYQTFNNLSISMNTSDMIDQLTRIQAEYHVEKHLGTITLTRSIRKRSLFELTSRYIHWLNLNFKEEFLRNDFQSIHRINGPKKFIYLFIIFILIGSVLQSLILNYLNIYYFLFFPLIIITLIILIILFHYSIRIENSNVNKKFYVYLNVLICLTLATIMFVAIQYYSIQNFKYLFIEKQSINETIAPKLRNFSLNNQIKYMNSNLFDRQYHEYLVLSPIYPLYFCTLFRQCSWMIKTLFIIICSILQLYILEYIWLTSSTFMPSITTLHHYTAFTLIIFHNILLILISYVHEWLEKIDFIWLKQIDNERLMIIRQRNQLIQQLSSIFPARVINYYLNTNSNSSLTQHYHSKYEHMGLLYIRFHLSTNQDEFPLIDFVNNIDYLLKNQDKYFDIVMHRKSTITELMFSMDLNNSLKSIQQLMELLFQINERLKPLQMNLTACLHIGSINEILIHFEKSPKIDIWSEHISFLQLLLSKIQINHCLVTSSVYNLLNDLYLFRTAGSILNTQMNIENNTTIYFLLGRLIGDNIFQGRNTLPLTINQPTNDTIRQSSSTDESQFSQHQYKNNSSNDKNLSLTTTTSSSGIVNDQQSLIKQSSRKHVRISNPNSYCQTLLQALNPTTNDLQQRKIIQSNDKKCLMLTQNIINGSTDDRSKSTPPSINRPFTSQQKSCTEDNLRQLLSDQSSKDLIKPSHSLSTNNEETISSFSGWDEPLASSVLINNDKQQDSIKKITPPPIVDCYYPSHPCDLSFTVNMTTTTTDTKSITPPQQQQSKPMIPKFRAVPFNLARKLVAETSESEMSIHHEPWTRNIAYQSNNFHQTRLSSSYNNLSKYVSHSKESSSTYHADFLQRWLDDQLNQFRSHIKQTPPIIPKKFNRYSNIDIDSTDDESDTIHENTFPILNPKPKKRSYNHIRYKPLQKTSHLIRHESLKYRNRPLLFENNQLQKYPQRTDSTSMPRSDISDLESSRPENLSQSVLSNLGSEYDNMYANSSNSKKTIPTKKSNSQILSDESDDDTTLATTINRCYF